MKRLFFSLGVFSLFTTLFFLGSSCNPNIEYASENVFQLSPDDYLTKVPQGANIPFKLFIQEKNDLRDNFYQIKYFGHFGDGVAYFGKEFVRLQPNEWVTMTNLATDEISGKKFFLFNYTPYSSGSHQITVTVRNRKGVERKVDLSLSVLEQ